MPRTSRQAAREPPARANGRAARRACRGGRPRCPTEKKRDELVEQVAREIQLRGLPTPAVHFLQASRPYRPLGANAMLFFDPVLRGLFGGELEGATAILADDAGIELLIARLEDIDDETAWDA